MKNYKNGSLWMAATFAAVVSSPMTANAAELEEVTVTATKQEKSVQDVSIAMTAISQELQNSTIRDLTDLNGFAPNVTIDENGSRGGGGADITIRGISATRTDDNSFDAPIAVMVDGIYLGTLSGQLLENFDLERVEILRGPQGTLFGKNTVGGVVHVIRSRPTGELGARFKATTGENSRREFRGVVNTPIIEDVLAAKFFGTVLSDDGFRTNVTTGNTIADLDYSNFGATFLYTPSDDFEATFTLENFDDKSKLNAYHTNYNVLPGVIAAPTDPNSSDYSGGFTSCLAFQAAIPGACRTSLATPGESSNNQDNNARLDTDAVTLNMSYQLSEDIELVSVTGYRQQDEYRIFDFDGSPVPFITIERFNEFDQFSEELRLDGTVGDVTFSTGIYYFNSEFTQDWITGDSFWSIIFGASAADPNVYGLCAAGVLPGLACDQGLTSIAAGTPIVQILFENQETTSYAVFGQMEWEINESWTMAAGLRWTREEKDFTAGQAYLTTIDRQSLRNFSGFANLNNSWTEVSPKLGLTYEINDTSIVYGTWSQGFHSGGFFGVNQNISDFERDQYDPETATNWEFGYKSTHFDNSLRLNISAFYNDFEDKQESFVGLDPRNNTVTSIFDNAASVIYKGFEVEAQYVANEYFRAFFNLGTLDAEYDQFETDINATDGLDIVEDATFLTPRRAPEFTYGVGGTVTLPVAQGVVEIYAKYNKIDEAEGDLLNTPLARQEERSDLTASIGYYAETWSVSVFGTNLTDEEAEGFTPIATLFAVGTVNRPRTYGLEFSFDL